MTPFKVKRVDLDAIQDLRQEFATEMDCQLIHDSIHARKGWSVEYLIEDNGRACGYGSMAIGGPWSNDFTIYEFYLQREYRIHANEIFRQLIAESDARKIEVQTNASLLCTMLYWSSQDVRTESMLYHDGCPTTLSSNGCLFRQSNPGDQDDLRAGALDEGAKWVLELDGKAIAAGDIMYHYNFPYGDIYMKVASPNRQMGFGSYLVQELKRVCYDAQRVPMARCDPQNVASQRTLARAGFEPYGAILSATLNN